MINQEEYRKYCSEFKSLWLYLKSKSLPEEQVISEICQLRHYNIDDMYDMLSTVEFVFLADDFDDSKLQNVNKDLGVLNKSGTFLTKGRYTFPVRDMLGNIVALIGWYPDEKKYITTPSYLFSKECMFFGMEQLNSTGIGKRYYLVEGIFDCISVRSLGLHCVAQMGITASRYKQVMYGLFSKMIAIPDNDKQGREVVKYNKWGIPSNSKYLQILSNQIKDVDDLIKTYDRGEVKEMLNDIWGELDQVVQVKL